MKYLLILVLFISQLAFAVSGNSGRLRIVNAGEKSMFGDFERGTCYPLFPMQYVIIGKIDATTYEMAALGYMSPHAILRVGKHTHLSRGRANISAVPVTTKTLPMNDGFEGSYDFWKECGVK